MTDNQRLGEQDKSDQNSAVAPKRVGFLLDPRKSGLDDMVDAVHRAWEESDQSSATNPHRDPEP